MAFGSLFQYISKGNKSSEQIAMTAPVIAAQKTDANEWFVSFVMPAGSALADMPDPNDSRVVLRELGTEICIGGYWDCYEVCSDGTFVNRRRHHLRVGSNHDAETRVQSITHL